MERGSFNVSESGDRDRRLYRWVLQAAARDLMPDERVSWCLRRVQPGRDHVSVYYSPRIHRAHYKNLIVCGSVWMCPICAAKISERRRLELTRAVDLNGHLQVALVTFTLQHDKSMGVGQSLDALMEAYRWMKGGRHRPWEAFEKDSQLVGSVRGLETTYGANGWHPHSHSLFFFEGSACLDGAETFLKTEWIRSLEKLGYSASDDHGVDFRTAARDVAAYVAKIGHEPLDKKRPGRWTMEHEVTKSQTKIARNGKGRSPTELLSAFAVGDKASGKLWREYARHFKGRRQLVWSRGMRAALHLDREESDEEIARRTEEDSILLAMLPLSVWRVILGNDARGEVLEIASSGDVGELLAFLRRIGCHV